MEQINNISTEPLPLKSLLRKHDVRLWQVVKRFLSSGVHITEPRLSRILNGIEEPRPIDKQQLDRIEKELSQL